MGMQTSIVGVAKWLNIVIANHLHLQIKEVLQGWQREANGQRAGMSDNHIPSILAEEDLLRGLCGTFGFDKITQLAITNQQEQGFADPCQGSTAFQLSDFDM